MTVVLTTSSPLDAARCDKVAVLATGGHLAFFGTPDAARGYFGADSLEEIYERLAGLGDPAAAWSRRFSQFSRTVAGFTSTATVPPPPGPARLLPDTAGPHSAGRVSTGALTTTGLLDDELAEAELDVGQDAAESAREGGQGTNKNGAAERAAPPVPTVVGADQAERRRAGPIQAHAGGNGGRAGRGAARLSRAARPRGIRPGAAGRVVLGGVRGVLRRPGLRPAAGPPRVRHARARSASAASAPVRTCWPRWLSWCHRWPSRTR